MVENEVRRALKYSCAPECPHCHKMSVQPFAPGEIFCPICLETFDLETLQPGIFEIVKATGKGVPGLAVW